VWERARAASVRGSSRPDFVSLSALVIPASRLPRLPHTSSMAFTRSSLTSILSRSLPRSQPLATSSRLARPFSSSMTRAAGPIESAMMKKLQEALGEEANVKIRNE
jgi:hypothetical protein